MNQRCMVIKELLDKGFLLHKEMSKKGVKRVPAIIFDLRLKGIDIERQSVSEIKKNGELYKDSKYVLQKKSKAKLKKFYEERCK